jgi:four helix bundle protein
MPIQSFRDLVVWQRSMVLVEKVYELTNNFPRSERFGLTAQIRRCESIPSNIAGRLGRATTGTSEYRLRSEAELQTQLEIACR